MTGYLTTHVLDTARGCPAAGLKIDLYRLEGETRTHLRSLTTNADGRTDEQILPAAEFQTGTYELLFHCGDYLDAQGVPAKEPRFLD
ncbi:5-hydroxyisourate hydrolase, partial [Rhodobacteraceae bacterium R_SAG2]|nr:5-hydroxyisourate hydrolase [Rhodobacteraceae bacterium R_SAG2]